MKDFSITIAGKDGLHLKPAQAIVACASGFVEVSVSICLNDNCVDGKSIMSLLALGVTESCVLRFKVESSQEGESAEKQEAEVVEALKKTMKQEELI